MQYVNVHVHQDGLFIERPIVVLDGGGDGGVTWQFLGIPNDVVPFIQFGPNLPVGAVGFPPPTAPATPANPAVPPSKDGLPWYSFGPFTEVTAHATQIVGRGNVGLLDGQGSVEHHYMLSLQRFQPIANPIVGFGVITNQAGPSNGPNFEVTYDPGHADPQMRFRIEPEAIIANPGDLVTWHLRGPHLAGVIPIPLFFSGPVGPTPGSLGPFTGITLMRFEPGLEGGDTHYTLIGHGVGYLQGRFRFDIKFFQQGVAMPSLREGLASIGHGDDPSIDPPPPPPDH